MPGIDLTYETGISQVDEVNPSLISFARNKQVIGTEIVVDHPNIVRLAKRLGSELKGLSSFRSSQARAPAYVKQVLARRDLTHDQESSAPTSKRPLFHGAQGFRHADPAVAGLEQLPIFQKDFRAKESSDESFEGRLGEVPLDIKTLIRALRMRNPNHQSGLRSLYLLCPWKAKQHLILGREEPMHKRFARRCIFNLY